MKSMVELHDEILEYEKTIAMDIEILSDQRERMYRKNDRDILRKMTTTLEAILYDVEKMKAWIESQLSGE